MPKITVIVPVYKVEPYLRRCINSILAQTFTDFELILVDDGSPDNCGAISDDYASQHEHIYVIHQPNGGLSAARNAGIDWALANDISQWLAFIDSDDWVHPQYLEYLYRAIVENNVKISVCDFKPTKSMHSFDKPLYESQTWAWDLFFIKHNDMAVVAWNKLYAKELFYGLRYPFGKIHEDEFLTYKLFFQAKKISRLPKSLYYYYQNPQGISKSHFNIKHLDAIEALEERLDFVFKNRCESMKAFCVNSFLYICSNRVLELRRAEEITLNTRIQRENDIRRKVKRVLLLYGLRYAPPWQDPWYYDFVFPRLNNVARQTIRFAGKLREKEDHANK